MTVFVPHVISKQGPGGSTEVDLTPAKKFGNLEYLLEANAMADPQSAQLMLRHKLRHYSAGDLILLGGDMASTAMAVAIAAGFNGGHVYVLRWDSLYREYSPIFINCNPKE